MASERTRHAVAVAGAALMLAGAAVLAATWPDEARAWVGAGLLAACAAAWGGTALAVLVRVPRPAPPEPPFGLPPDLMAAQAALLAAQARIEHAPVAMWKVGAGAPEPLNTAARRLLAQGGAADRAALLALVAAARAPGRSVAGIDSERGRERALLAASALTLAGQGSERLVALMPIESELESEALQAWQQLVHVLTHEIMNSLTPIASLARSTHEMLAEPATQAADLATALEAIARRAAHLVAFVDSYRSVSAWPAPALAAVSLSALFDAVSRLVAPAWQARPGGSARFSVEPPTLELRADAAQLEQVLINLAKNAFEATAATASPALEVQARLVRGGRLAISVADNGPGVAAGDEARIFTPFFSTRAGGGGIGLAVVRHLVHGMGGTVRHTRRAGGGACFVLTF